jgi:hypothetical protein
MATLPKVRRIVTRVGIRHATAYLHACVASAGGANRTSGRSRPPL